MNRRQFLAAVAYALALPLVAAAGPGGAPWLMPDETGWSPLDQARIWLSFAPWARSVDFEAGGRRWRARRESGGWHLVDGAGRICHTQHERRR